MRNLIRQLLPWKNLGTFLLILIVTSVLKNLAFLKGWIAQPLAAWELAAMFHVWLVASKMMKFSGFVFAKKSFNSRFKSIVVNVSFCLAVAKLIVVVALMQMVQQNGQKTQIINSVEELKGFSNTVHEVAPYIILMPLVFFLFANFCAWLHVTKQASLLGFHNTNQERYLVGLMKFVDAPVVLPFAILLTYFKFDPIVDPSNKGMVFGIIGCCLLLVSNLLTGVFDEHWSDVTKNRREHSSGLA